MTRLKILRKEKEKLSFDRKGLNKKLPNKRKSKEGSTKGEKLWDDANARQRAIPKTKKNAIVNKKEKQLKKDIDILKEEIRV